MFSLSIPSPAGLLRVSSNGRAITQLDWAENYNRAIQDKPDAVCQLAADELAAYFAGQLRVFTVPVAPSGTAFQQRVWAALQKIDYGKTVTYGSLANDMKSAPRAVGGACGRNIVPILIPCHRVLGAGGALGGYSGFGGLQTKAFLLGLET